MFRAQRIVSGHSKSVERLRRRQGRERIRRWSLSAESEILKNGAGKKNISIKEGCYCLALRVTQCGCQCVIHVGVLKDNSPPVLRAVRLKVFCSGDLKDPRAKSQADLKTWKMRHLICPRQATFSGSTNTYTKSSTFLLQL